MNTKHYVNTKAAGVVETVDEFETYREAKAMLSEYRLSNPEMGYYLSTRSTKVWKQ